MLKSIILPIKDLVKYLLLFVWGIYQLVLGGLLVCLLFGIYWLADYSQYFAIKNLAKENPTETAFMKSEKERILGDSLALEKIIKDRKSISSELLLHKWLPWDSIPELIRELTLIAEDGKFYSHEGFDLQELQYALVANQQKGKTVRGASTISQQVVKNIFLSSEKSYERKLKEALLTVLLEQHVTKDRILELYLNVAQFGPAVFGIQAGAEYHFSKPVTKLNFNESIELIALLPSPNKWHPHSNHRAYRRHKMRMVKNMALYNRYKNKIPEDVLTRFNEYAEEESQERWNKLHDGQKGEVLDSLPSTSPGEAGTPDNF